METATVFDCAETFGLDSRALLVVSDHNRDLSPFVSPSHAVARTLRALPRIVERLL